MANLNVPAPSPTLKCPYEVSLGPKGHFSVGNGAGTFRIKLMSRKYFCTINNNIAISYLLIVAYLFWGSVWPNMYFNYKPCLLYNSEIEMFCYFL